MSMFYAVKRMGIKYLWSLYGYDKRL